MKVKIGFYLLSMVIFLIIVIILGTDIPVYFGNNWEFVGWNVFFRLGVLVPLVCFALILLAFVFLFYFQFKMKSTPIGPILAIQIENVTADNMSFIASYFFPLVSFAVGTTWRHVIVLLLLFVILGVVYIQSDNYYYNPSLVLFGFRSYKIKGLYNGKVLEKTFIIRGKLKEGDNFEFVILNDKTYYAIKK